MARTAGHGDSGLRRDGGRRLTEWSSAALLRRVHATLARMVRSGPEAAAATWDVVIDSCSARAKRCGALTGPNPTDRAKRGTKYHLVVASEGLLAALPSAANVNDTMLFPALLRRAVVVCAAIARLYADAAYHSAENRKLHFPHRQPAHGLMKTVL